MEQVWNVFCPRFLGVMPGYSQYDNALATKIVSFYPENKEKPTHQAWILLLDPESGSLNAVCLATL